MKALIEEYRRTLKALEERRDTLCREKRIFDNRLLLLETEIDEINEVLYWLRDYA